VIPENIVPQAAPEEELILDNAVPLAGEHNIGECWVHWIILLVTLIYAAYGLIRYILRRRELDQLEGRIEDDYNRKGADHA
ncbi:MAG: hypothetical protein RRZ93_02605, partial [Ruthenibacterium sp.]